nr:methyltransferase domain-containing protein [uncultured Desulfuromonas sp.]
MRTTIADALPGQQKTATRDVDEQAIYLETCKRFDSVDVALKYRARKNTFTSRNRSEWNCIKKALKKVSEGAHVLDLPCGSGRLEPLLEKLGYLVTAADYSKHMVDTAMMSYMERTGCSELPPSMRFTQSDVMHMDFTDGEFDAVICNRLLHHYPTSGLRQKVLKECARVSKGVVIISYFDNAALSSLRFHLKNLLLSRTPTDRIPIWYGTLKQDLNAAGLRCTSKYRVHKGVSPQTYLLLERV